MRIDGAPAGFGSALPAFESQIVTWFVVGSSPLRRRREQPAVGAKTPASTGESGPARQVQEPLPGASTTVAPSVTPRRDITVGAPIDARELAPPLNSKTSMPASAFHTRHDAAKLRFIARQLPSRSARRTQEPRAPSLRPGADRPATRSPSTSQIGDRAAVDAARPVPVRQEHDVHGRQLVGGHVAHLGVALNADVPDLHGAIPRCLR